MDNILTVRRLAFIAEWYQEEAGIVRRFLMSFCPCDSSLEVFEQGSKKTFLRRTKMLEISAKDFFIGSKISVFGRQFDIVDYGDEITKNTLAKFRKKTFLLLKPYVIPSLGKILTNLDQSDMRISHAAMVTFSPEMARKFLGENNKGDVKTADLMNELLSKPSIGIVLIADNVIEKIKACQNQSNNAFDLDIPPSLKTLFEEEYFRNGIYCSQSDADADREIDLFFNSKSNLNLTATFKNTTLALIKPHAVKEGKLGHIIADITNHGFKINAFRMQLLEHVNCEEFYEVYRGILPEFIQMVSQLASGNSVAIEIGCSDDSKNAYKEFREFCGPIDPEVAKLLRPNSLRAKYGINKVLNAVHCTDLPEDTILELQYLFKIMANVY